jgi:cold shock CspA family protein
MNVELSVKARPRHWLPLPGGISEVAKTASMPQVDESDQFSKATVEEFYPKQGYGFILTDSGTKVKFDLQIVSLVGEKASPEHIKVGGRVGYDLGKTSKGPRVCILKIY